MKLKNLMATDFVRIWVCCYDNIAS